MNTLSKPLGAQQVAQYYRESYSNPTENYYSADSEMVGQWAGAFAAELGLSGPIAEDHFRRLAEGQDPLTGQQLVQHRRPTPYGNAKGVTVTPMGHRAAYDSTFAAPKSVSLVALVGGDWRVRMAHQDAVAVALEEIQPYVQARMGGNVPAKTTGRFAAAVFQHDSARPVNGYAAPQLHTHCVVFNMTRPAAGAICALQPRSLYDSQQLATAVYRNELAIRLAQLGYIVERGPTDAPEIRGISVEYREESSPRHAQILAALAADGRSGPASAEIAQKDTREAKRADSQAIMHATHTAIAAVYGHEALRAVSEAKARGSRHIMAHQTVASHAVTYAIDRNIEREAVVDERSIRRDALVLVMGTVPTHRITDEVAGRVVIGDLLERQRTLGQAATHYTTPEMVRLEQETMAVMLDGRGRVPTMAYPLLAHESLSPSQRDAALTVLESRDVVTALHGVAGSGKTTTVAAIRQAAEWHGYQVKGLAPTAKAAEQLAGAGMPSQTLQKHLAAAHEEVWKTLYVLDESSLASTRQMHTFLRRLGPEDRVLLVGDTRQHEGIEAGRLFAQLQEAGMRTAQLDDIVRQKTPAHKAVVELLARGEIPSALKALHDTQRITEEPNREARHTAVAKAYAKAPDRTMVIAPDNASRELLNEAIYRELSTNRPGHARVVMVPVLSVRHEMTGADRAVADRYHTGDVLRYSNGSTHFQTGTYATVTAIHSDQNHITVRDTTGHVVTYNPSRLRGVAVYTQDSRAFAVGDRVQCTAPSRALRVKNRDLGTIHHVSPTHMRIRMDTGHTVGFALTAYRHLQRGYATTSYRAQGLTADRVILALDTDRGAGDRRTAYTSLSRARYDVQIFTNDIAAMGLSLNRDRSHSQAIAV